MFWVKMGRYYRRHHGRHYGKHHKIHYGIFYKINIFIRRYPIFSAILTIFLSIFLIRVSLSDNLFGNDVSEFRLWFLFFAVVLGIIGIMAIKVWFSNNVSNFNTQHNLNWK